MNSANRPIKIHCIGIGGRCRGVRYVFIIYGD